MTFPNFPKNINMNNSKMPCSNIKTHNTLGNGEWLLKGESLVSEDGKVELKMQNDGKLAVYKNGQSKFQNTADQRDDIKGVRMQPDGNLVMYDNSGNAVWHTNTAGSTGDSTVCCVVQNDGNAVLYKGTAIWATNTNNYS